MRSFGFFASIFCTNGLVSGLFVLRNEQASILWRDSKDIEEVGGGFSQIDSFGVIWQSKIRRHGSDCREMFEDSVLCAPIKVAEVD